MSYIRVKQVRSGAGRLPNHILTLKALGLRGVGSVVTLPATDPIKGMIYKVHYLLEVEKLNHNQ